jgi:hypothetical protein
MYSFNLASVCNVNFSLLVSQIPYELECFSVELLLCFYVGWMSCVPLSLLQNYTNIPENYFRN